jgi:hypothetical protein
MEPVPIKLYFDYKGPFAYLAKDEREAGHGGLKK